MKYQGSKSRIAKYIVHIIQSYIDKMGKKCNGYWEPFVGGANVIDKIEYPYKYGSDLNKYLIALLTKARDSADEIPDTISKIEYDKVRNNKEAYPDWYVGLVGFCASYNSKFFGGYANGVKTKIGTVRNYTDEAIRNLKKQAPNLKGIDFSVRNFSCYGSNHFVVYCDIPYRNSTNYATGEFPYDKFYGWCKEMAKDNIVLISEYWMPENDFECIWQGELKCTLDHNKRETKVEKLFVVRGGYGIE